MERKCLERQWSAEGLPAIQSSVASAPSTEDRGIDGEWIPDGFRGIRFRIRGDKYSDKLFPNEKVQRVSSTAFIRRNAKYELHSDGKLRVGDTFCWKREGTLHNPDAKPSMDISPLLATAVDDNGVPSETRGVKVPGCPIAEVLARDPVCAAGGASSCRAQAFPSFVAVGNVEAPDAGPLSKKIKI